MVEMWECVFHDLLQRDVAESGIGPGRGNGVQGREDSRSVAFSREDESIVSGVH